jgi:hydroxyacylglutathione hydrolase
MIHVQKFVFNPMEENTYLLWNEKANAIIIDPGCYFTTEQETVEKFIKNKNLKPVQLINTHCHLDHVFGIKWITKTYHLELFIHPAEEKVLEFAPATGMMWGFGYDVYKGRFHFLKQADSINIDEDKLEVIFTPGHSPGSICFYCSEQNFLIGGDVLFRESIGRTDLPGGNHQQLLNSIQKQLFVLPDETIVYPGHGPETTIGHEKKYNPFLNELA